MDSKLVDFTTERHMLCLYVRMRALLRVRVLAHGAYGVCVYVLAVLGLLPSSRTEWCGHCENSYRKTEGESVQFRCADMRQTHFTSKTDGGVLVILHRRYNQDNWSGQCTSNATTGISASGVREYR